MNSLARVLSSLIRASEDSPHAREFAVIAAWNTAAGAGVRHASAPVRFDGSVFVVCTIDATWKTQLERLASQYIFRINSILGAPVVRRVNFTVDPAAVAAYNAAPEPVIRTGDPQRCARELSADAQVIEDPELRDVFLRAASKCMARAAEEGKRR
ncbi:MAG: DUF721 domain-containing protein [Actinomycetota bacterium]|nr:DUF721 domain-containing protein [Actinomycetota bacterium]